MDIYLFVKIKEHVLKILFYCYTIIVTNGIVGAQHSVLCLTYVCIKLDHIKLDV